mmetsp:Transcript_36135/g.47478  ORF Transcript_36135/g.47478 Transcript_36135/m.47478 type:complete len:90 (-) Transcript_36135:485-754(-)
MHQIQTKTQRGGRSVARLSSLFSLGQNNVPNGGSSTDLHDAAQSKKNSDKMGQRYMRLMEQNSLWMQELERMGKNLDILKYRERQIKQY